MYSTDVSAILSARKTLPFYFFFFSFQPYTLLPKRIPIGSIHIHPFLFSLLFHSFGIGNFTLALYLPRGSSFVSCSPFFSREQRDFFSCLSSGLYIFAYVLVYLQPVTSDFSITPIMCLFLPFFFDAFDVRRVFNCKKYCSYVCLLYTIFTFFLTRKADGAR